MDVLLPRPIPTFGPVVQLTQRRCDSRAPHRSVLGCSGRTLANALDQFPDIEGVRVENRANRDAVNSGARHSAESAMSVLDRCEIPGISAAVRPLRETSEIYGNGARPRGIDSCWHSWPSLCISPAFAVSDCGQCVHYMMKYPRSVINVNVSFKVRHPLLSYMQHKQLASKTAPRNAPRKARELFTTALDAASGRHCILVASAYMIAPGAGRYAHLLRRATRAVFLTSSAFSQTSRVPIGRRDHRASSPGCIC
jgi:hypothetical protein